MSLSCNDPLCDEQSGISESYRKILWICLIANAVMFVVQIIASWFANSVSLLANSLDFFSDAANYGISLFVLGKILRTKAKASIIKGISLGAIGVWTAFETVHHTVVQALPEPLIMTYVSIIALAVNVGCAVLLFKHRSGDSNKRSVWLCSRNDALGNIAVMFAAGGVFASDTIWPDIIVAAILAWLALSASWQIVRHAKQELSE
jgi:Co/Zn/Cd efflux system component